MCLIVEVQSESLVISVPKSSKKSNTSIRKLHTVQLDRKVGEARIRSTLKENSLRGIDLFPDIRSHCQIGSKCLSIDHSRASPEIKLGFKSIGQFFYLQRAQSSLFSQSIFHPSYLNSMKMNPGQSIVGHKSITLGLTADFGIIANKITTNGTNKNLIFTTLIIDNDLNDDSIAGNQFTRKNILS